MDQLVIHPAQQSPDPTPRSYAPIVVGVTLTIIALHMVITRPLLKRIDSLNQQVLVMQSELDAVAGSQADAWRTNDLLTALTIQAERLDSADLALSRFDGLAGRLDQLNDRVATLSKHTDDAFKIVADFDSLHTRLTAAAGESGAIDRDLRDIEKMTDRVDAMAARTPQHRDSLDVLALQSSEMVAIATRIATEEKTIATAKSTLGELTSLASTLKKTETTDAINTSNQLIAMGKKIAIDGTALLGPANTVLAGLRQATGGLETQGERLESLIESAEVLQDFETELAHHIRGLEDIRRELIEFAMIDSTIDRVATTLEPLTELARLRRIQPQDLQLVVDGLKEQRLEEAANAEMIAEKQEQSKEPVRTADILVPDPVQILR